MEMGKKLFKMGKEYDEENLVDEEELMGIFPEDILENMKAKLKEFTQLSPRLYEKRDLINKRVDRNQEKIKEIDEMIPKLQDKKNSLEQDQKDLKNELDTIEEIEGILEKIK